MPEQVAITITATTMEGLKAKDPEVTVQIGEISPVARQLARQVINNFRGAVRLLIPRPEGFPVWQVNILFSRYDAVSGFLFQPGADQTPAFATQVARLPNRWTPQFTPLNALDPARFEPFTKVVAASTAVDLKEGPPPGDLHASYDALKGEPQVLAKAALLNLFAVLTDEQDPVGLVPWFSYVRKIVRMDQERFVAEVDPALFENVQTVLNHLNSTYKGQGFFTEPPADLPLHIPNIPPQYDSANNLVQIVTLKKEYEQGNLQLTLSFLRLPDRVAHLLDCDLDENRNIVLHSFDIVRHLINGGTSPISMHEYIVEHSAEQAPNGIATIDTGYLLV
jgi:hypothetical protein